MKHVQLIVIFFFILYSNIGYAENKLIISGHHDYPPVMWEENGKLVGVGPQLAAKIFNELGVPFEIKFTGPWKRVQENARSGEIDIIVGLYSNTERRSYMVYTIPYMTDPTSIFVMKEKIFSFNKWENLIGKKGITMYGDSFGEELDGFIEEKLTMHKAYNVDTIFKLLDTGRSDYILWGYYPCLVNVYANGYKDKIIPLPQYVVVENMYMAFSKKSKYVHLVPEVNKIIKKIKTEGHIENWTKKYLDHFIKK